MADALIEQLAQWLVDAEKVVVLSGAGLSAESGIPTFRGPGGLWREHRAEDLATPEAFSRNPELVWEFYNYRREKMSKAEPNAAHFALTRLEHSVEEFYHITQNVDGLASKAGGKNLVELHGNLFATRCSQCGLDHPDNSGILDFPPKCTNCGGLLRPSVVWFGESVDMLSRAVEVIQGCDCLLVIGTSAVVHPAAGLVMTAKTWDSIIVEMNIEKTPISDSLNLFIEGPVGETLPKAVNLAFSN